MPAKPVHTGTITAVSPIGIFAGVLNQHGIPSSQQ